MPHVTNLAYILSDWYTILCVHVHINMCAHVSLCAKKGGVSQNRFHELVSKFTYYSCVNMSRAARVASYFVGDVAHKVDTCCAMLYTKLM